MIERNTIFSPDRKYRYTLWRDWSAQMKDGVFFTEDPHLDYYPGKRDTFVQFIGLNPSTATETTNDATVRRCINFAKFWGFGAMCMTNIFAWRDTDPAKMKGQHDPVGQDNDTHLIKVGLDAGLIIAAWGTHGTHFQRGYEVVGMLRNRLDKKLYCLGKTANGHPKHPLYLSKTTTPIQL